MCVVVLSAVKLHGIVAQFFQANGTLSRHGVNQGVARVWRRVAVVLHVLIRSFQETPYDVLEPIAAADALLDRFHLLSQFFRQRGHGLPIIYLGLFGRRSTGASNEGKHVCFRVAKKVFARMKHVGVVFTLCAYG
jgi:hypothetical protein